jgi:tetratricopeptide (TPR) repeat protein
VNHRFGVILGLVCAFVQGSTGVLASAPPGVAAPQAREELRSRALKAFENGNFVGAEQVLQQLLEQNPDDIGALEMLAAALDSQEKFDEAERCYDRALRKAPHSAPLLNDLGNHYVRRNDPEHARTAFAKVLAINPEHQNANLQLARIAADRRQGAEALARLQHVKQAGPPIELLRAEALYWAGKHEAALARVTRVEGSGENAAIEFSAGMALARMEQFSRAETAFTRALAQAPTDFDILLNLGHAAGLAGHRDRAERALATALHERPDDVDARFELGRLRASTGSDIDAIVLLGEAAKRAPQRADISLALARALEDAGYLSDAVLTYDHYLALRPGDDGVRRDRAFALGRSSQLDEGTAGLKSYIAKHPGDQEAHYDLAVLYATDWNTDLALAEGSKAIALSRDSAGAGPAHYLRGVVLHHAGRFAEALEDLKFVVEHRPDEILALDQLARVYLALQRPKEAEDVLRHAQAVAPEDRTVMMDLGRTLLKLGRHEEAEALLRKSQEVRAGRPEPRRDPGLYAFLMLSAPEQQARRIRNLQDANRATPEPELKLQLGQVLLTAGKVEESAAVFRELLSMQPNTAIAAQAGRSLLRSHEYELAAAFLKVAAANDSAVRLNLATALFFSAGPQEALAELESVAAEGRTPEYYRLEAGALDSLGRGPEAVEALNRGLESTASPPDVAVRAAQLLVRNGRAADALGLLNRTLAAQPEQPDALLAKAMVLESMGSTEQAERLLVHIESGWPEWGRPYLVHGLLLRDHSRTVEARKLLDTASALGEKTEQATSLLQFFTGGKLP